MSMFEIVLLVALVAVSVAFTIREVMRARQFKKDNEDWSESAARTITNDKAALDLIMHQVAYLNSEDFIENGGDIFEEETAKARALVEMYNILCDDGLYFVPVELDYDMFDEVWTLVPKESEAA